MPLVEAIFELQWSPIGAPQDDSAGHPGFGFLLGRFYDRVRSEYPELVNLPTARLPAEQTPYRARHQFRTVPGAWPLIQFGPGLLTVNETQRYRWDCFGPRLSRAITAFFDAYPSELSPLRPRQAVLRYINSIPIDRDKPSLVRFLREQLHTSLSVDPALFDDPGVAEHPAGLSFSMTFPLAKQAGLGTVAISTGNASGRPCVVWQLEARALGDQVPTRPRGLDDWLGRAHALLLGWFTTLSRGALSDSFHASP
jgi:uncharacterized protein (TIGR04255 family)